MASKPDGIACLIVDPVNAASPTHSRIVCSLLSNQPHHLQRGNLSLLTVTCLPPATWSTDGQALMDSRKSGCSCATIPHLCRFPCILVDFGVDDIVFCHVVHSFTLFPSSTFFMGPLHRLGVASFWHTSVRCWGDGSAAAVISGQKRREQREGDLALSSPPLLYARPPDVPRR